MLILALSPYHIHFGRIAYETMFATTLLLGFFIAYLQTVKSKKLIWFVLGVLTLLGACWTYPSPQFIIPVFLVLALVAAMLTKQKDVTTKQLIIPNVVFLIAVILSFIPHLLNPAIDKRTLGYVITQGSGRLIGILASWFRSFNLEFLFDKGDIFAYRSGTKIDGIFLPVMLPFFLFGLFIATKNFAKKDFSWIMFAILLIACGLPSALTWSVPYGPRFLPMVIPLTILLALGWDYCMGKLSQQKQWVQKSVSVASLLIIFYQVIFFADAYFVHFANLSQPEFPAASKEMALYLKGQAQTVYFLEGRECLSWEYEYLHLWYFADLPNKEMIAWNNRLRTIRYKSGNPVDGYYSLTYPTGKVSHVVLYPTTKEMADSPRGSILVHCGISLKDLNPHSEKVVKVFYMYDITHTDPMYIVSLKL